jgi:hypothetical protein
MADHEMYRDVLRPVDLEDQDSLFSVEKRIIHRLAGYLRDPVQAVHDLPGVPVIAAEPVLADGHQLIAELVAVGGRVPVDVAGIHQRHQHAIGGTAIGTDARRDFRHRDRVPPRAKNLKHAQRA